MTPVQSHTIHIPLTSWEFELTAQDKKVMAVALASFVFFAFQFGLSLTVSLALSFAFSLVTYFCPRNESDWFNVNFDFTTVAFLSAFLILKPLIIQAVALVFNVPLPPLPQVGLAELLLKEPWRVVPLAILAAPVSEEILFRGFLTERLEDLGLPQIISSVAQAVFFGAIHLRRAVSEGMEIPVLLLLSAGGYGLSWMQRESNDSLIAPMMIHSANNVGACTYVFLNSGV